MAQKSDAPHPPRRPTAALAYRHLLLAEGLAVLLRNAGFRVLTWTDSVEALCQQVRLQQADLVLLDWQLASGNEALLWTLASVAPEASVVILAGPQPERGLRTAVQAGVHGYLSLNMSGQEFAEALRVLSRGGVVVSPHLMDPLKQQVTSLKRGLASSPDSSGAEGPAMAPQAMGNQTAPLQPSHPLKVTDAPVRMHLRRILNRGGSGYPRRAAGRSTQARRRHGESGLGPGSSHTP